MMRPNKIELADPEEVEEIGDDDDNDDEYDVDLDEINRLLNTNDIEPEEAEAECGNEDELDEIIRLAGGKELGVDEEVWTTGNEIRHEEASKEELLRRFGLIRRSKDRFSDESSASDEDEETSNGKKLAPIFELDAESLATTKDDRKSRFTNYSMSSAVIKRPDGLRQIDDHFEALYSTQYAEELEGEGPNEGEGEISLMIDPNNSERFRALLDGEEEAMRRKFPRELPDAELKQAVLRYAQAKEAREKEGLDQEETEQIRMPADSAKRSRWDCESIVSMYSNIYNHPTEIRENSRANDDIGANRKRNNIGLTKSETNCFEKMDTDELASVRSSHASTASTFRPKGETTEERRQRKQAIKEERRERRQEKKVNRNAFNEQKQVLDAIQRRSAIQKRTRQIK